MFCNLLSQKLATRTMSQYSQYSKLGNLSAITFCLFFGNEVLSGF